MMRRGLLIGVAVWVVLAIAGGWYFVSSQRLPEGVDLDSPRRATASFVNCLSMGHTAGAVACVIDGDEQRLLATRFAEAVGAGLDPEALTQLPPLDAEGKVAVDGDTATVTPVASEALDRPAAFVLQRRSGRWHVDLLATLGLSPAEARQYADRLAAAAAGLRVADD